MIDRKMIVLRHRNPEAACENCKWWLQWASGSETGICRSATDNDYSSMWTDGSDTLITNLDFLCADWSERE